MKEFFKKKHSNPCIQSDLLCDPSIPVCYEPENKKYKLERIIEAKTKEMIKKKRVVAIESESDL